MGWARTTKSGRLVSISDRVVSYGGFRNGACDLSSLVIGCVQRTGSRAVLSLTCHQCSSNYESNHVAFGCKEAKIGTCKLRQSEYDKTLCFLFADLSSFVKKFGGHVNQTHKGYPHKIQPAHNSTTHNPTSRNSNLHTSNYHSLTSL